MLGSRNEWRDRNVWLLIPSLPPLFAGIALAFGAEPHYTAAFCAILFIWPWFAYQEGPSPTEDPEYGFLRGTRVKLYAVGILLYLALALGLLSYSEIYGVVIFAITYPIRASVLALVFLAAANGDRKTISPTGKEEEESFHRMWENVGKSIIMLTWSILFVPILIATRVVAGSFVTGSSIGVVMFLLLSIILTYTAYRYARRAFRRETESRSSARSLADSLRKRRWWKQFEAAKKRSRGRG